MQKWFEAHKVKVAWFVAGFFSALILGTVVNNLSTVAG